MWLLTKVVSTVPGTVAGSQPVGAKAGLESVAGEVVTRDEYWSCQPWARTTAEGVGRVPAKAEEAVRDSAARDRARKRNWSNPPVVVYGYIEVWSGKFTWEG